MNKKDKLVRAKINRLCAEIREESPYRHLSIDYDVLAERGGYPDKYVSALICCAKCRVLSDKALMVVCKLPEAKEILLAAGKLSTIILLRVCELPCAKEILMVQVHRYGLCKEVQLKVCELHCAKEILTVQAQRYDGLCEEVQLKVCELPCAKEILMEEVRNHGLCKEVQLKVCELHCAKEILTVQAQRKLNYGGGLYYKEVQLKVCEIPDAKEILMVQMKNYGLYKETLLKICEFPCAKEIFMADGKLSACLLIGVEKFSCGVSYSQKILQGNSIEDLRTSLC